MPTPLYLSTGIDFRPEIPGLVTEYEERAAAVLGGYSWREWLRASREERIQSVGFLRLHRLIQLHSDDIADRESKARQRRAQHAAGRK